MKNILASAALVALTSGCVNAQSYTEVVKGNVIAVENLTRVVSVQRPHRNCYTVDVPVYGNNGGGSTNDTIVGALIGGAIGNQFGNGSGKDAATVLGAIVGADVANKNNRNSNVVGYRQENRCTTEYITELQERNSGYKVTIEVDGTTFTTISNRRHRVGQRVEVQKRYDF